MSTSLKTTLITLITLFAVALISGCGEESQDDLDSPLMSAESKRSEDHQHSSEDESQGRLDSLIESAGDESAHDGPAGESAEEVAGEFAGEFGEELIGCGEEVAGDEGDEL